MADRPRFELGIYSRTFERPNLRGVLDQVAAHGFGLVHFSFRSAGLSGLPEGLTETMCAKVRGEFTARRLRMAGVSATFNAIHPDLERRERETVLATQLILAAPHLGTSLVSLSTGTRDPHDMWRAHPANAERGAWSDLRRTVSRLLEAASRAGITLGIEPEHNNVVSSSLQARRLLDEFGGDPHLAIILDAANLLTPEVASEQGLVLEHAFELLAANIVVVHAKDFSASGDVAAGRGLLDYKMYFELLARHGVTAPVVIHEVEEADVDRARDFVLGHAEAAGLTPLPAPLAQRISVKRDQQDV